MALLSIENIPSDALATANLLNQRFAAVASVINGKLDYQNLTAGGVRAENLAADVLDKFYPVGSLYFNATVETNPNSLLGFGTWELYSQGRMPVGYNAAETEFNAVGKTGGEKTVSLTADQNGAHSHGVNDPSHNHGTTRDPVVTSSTGNSRLLGGSGQQTAWSTGSLIAGNFTGISIQSSGNGAPHNNLPPYVAVYIWRRTA